MNSLSVLRAGAMLMSLSTAALAGTDTPAGGVSKSELQAKIDYCKTCHGVAGQGYRGTVPMPRLAGQQPEYIKNQLQAFIEHRRTNPVMNNVAHVLSPAMLQGLADHFQNLNPKPLGGAPRDQIALGEKIYKEGVGEKVPACASCHGPQAKGADAFPRLAGQLYDYTIRKLTNWDKERGQDPAKPDTSAIMQPITHDLTQAQITAVAAYLSTLE
jgi:cytochrome c553